jgi:hypothetical protein
MLSREGMGDPVQRKTRQGNGHDCNEMRGRRAAAAAQPMIASRLMLRTLQTLVLVLVAALATATSAAAFAPESALRAFHDFLQPSVGALAAQPREAHQQNALGYGEVASDASLAAEGAAEAINIGEKGLAHVLARHFPGGVPAAGKSLFNVGETVPGLVRAAEGVTPVLQRGGNFQRIVDAGRAVGIDRATGAATNLYTVITDAAWKLVTTFPGVP